MLVATLFPNFDAVGFDLETAIETPKRLVITEAEAKQWAKAEIEEGRDPSVEWETTEYTQGPRKLTAWKTACNEEGSPEEWILAVEDVQFWRP